MRKFAVALARRSAPSVRVSAPSARQFSNFTERERAEEARYFRQEEQRKLAELRAKFESVLSREDTHEEKIELIEKLTAVDAPKSLISKLGLDDWKFAVPLGILAGVPAISNEFIILSAETQLLGVFMFSLATFYSQGGSALAATLDEYKADVHNKLKGVDTNMLREVHGTIDATEKVLSLEADIKQVHHLVDDLSVVQADILNYSAAHHYRDAIAKKIDALNSLEEQVTQNVRNRMVNKVKADVKKTFESDKKAKDAALEQALAVLAGGKTAKYGTDVVGGAFKASLQNYRTEYAKISPEKDELLVQLQKDIAAITVAPRSDAKGSNVYETHPVLK